MDGTLTKVGNRLKYINTEPKDWAKFLDACGEDEPNIPIIKIFKVFQLHTDTKIKVVTGRDEKYRQISLNWLHNHELWVETKDELFKLLNEFEYTPSIFDGILDSAKGLDFMNRGSSLPWDLMDYIIEKTFKGYLGLRSESPDLLNKFKTYRDFFSEKYDELCYAQETSERIKNEGNILTKK